MIQTVEINEQTPIAMLTMGQFLSFLRQEGVIFIGPIAGSDGDAVKSIARPNERDENVDTGKKVSGAIGATSPSSTPVDVNPNSRKIYGLEGIMEEFHVAKSTARDYKNGIFKPIIMQQGRKIILDAEAAWKIYSTKTRKDKKHRKTARAGSRGGNSKMAAGVSKYQMESE